MAPILPERAVRTVRIGIAALVTVALAAGVIGGVVASYLPFGAKQVTVQRGVASVGGDGNGTFQADKGGVSAYLPPKVMWTDRSGTSHIGDRPACLTAPGKGYMDAKVEAGYVWARGPEGESYPIVTWIRRL